MEKISKNRIIGTLANYLNDTKGSIAIIFAIVALPLVLIATGQVEYIRAANARQQLTSLADSAVLAGVSKHAVKYYIGSSQQIEKTTKIINDHFLLDEKLKSTITNFSFSADVTTKNDVVFANLCFKATVPSTIITINFERGIEISNCVSAKSADLIYIEYNVLLDASGSMSIGATADDLAKMLLPAAQGGMDGCIFACHIGGGDVVANSRGIKLRFNIVKEALVQNIEKLSSDPESRNFIKFNIYKYSNRVTQI